MPGGLYFSFSQKSVFLKHPSVYVVSLFVIVSVYVLCLCVIVSVYVLSLFVIVGVYVLFLCVIVSVYVGSNDIAGKLLLPPG